MWLSFDLLIGPNVPKQDLGALVFWRFSGL
jgi:hypothetical protein